VINYKHPKVDAKMNLPERWRVQPTDECLQALKQLLGADNVYLQYQ